MAEKLKKGDYVEVTSGPDEYRGRKGIVATDEADDDGDIKVLFDGDNETSYAAEAWCVLRRIAPTQAEIDDAVQTLKMAGTLQFTQRAKQWETQRVGQAVVKRREVEVGDDESTFYFSLAEAVELGEKAKAALAFDGTPSTIYGGVA